MMNVKPIGIGGYTDPTTAGYAVESSQDQEKKSNVEALLEVLESPTSESRTLRDIANDYDVRSIQPQDFSDMLSRLYDSGVISDEDYQSLSMLRVELDKAGYEIDEPVDLIEFCETKLREINEKLEDLDTEKVPEEARKTIRNQLAWLKKMAILQEEPESTGINALV
ncbi:MAG: hypothetical protein PVH19_04750 [Planctomycetia bacterium]